MKLKTMYNENMGALKRINGQINGVQKMIDDGRYCIDVIDQIKAAIHALYRVSERIMTKHLEHCVTDAFKGKSESKKIDEVIGVFKKLNKLP
ncbi:MAG: metal-sensitive transcriptional regulator [Candidatus Omnitrophica bacterium]|nr:metal-sensitive transcriptional regulator [Candidatus Omnitrophota bacterium]